MGLVLPNGLGRRISSYISPKGLALVVCFGIGIE